MIESTMPPRKPASRPSATPMIVDSTAAIVARNIEVWQPLIHTARLSVPVPGRDAERVVGVEAVVRRALERQPRREVDPLAGAHHVGRDAEELAGAGRRRSRSARRRRRSGSRRPRPCPCGDGRARSGAGTARRWPSARPRRQATREARCEPRHRAPKPSDPLQGALRPVTPVTLPSAAPSATLGEPRRVEDHLAVTIWSRWPSCPGGHRRPKFHRSAASAQDSRRRTACSGQSATACRARATRSARSPREPRRRRRPPCAAGP